MTPKKPLPLIACLLLSSLSVATTFACVTVNVTFPEAAVQQATDDYVQGLYREKERNRAQPSPKPEADKRAATQPPRTAWLLVPLLLSEALAAGGELKITVNSPETLQIRDKQVARLDALQKAEAAGSIGESNMGLLTFDHAGNVASNVRTQLTPLMDAENSDRKDLYNEILSSNGYAPSRLIDLQKSFARSFQSRAASGTWIQDDGGKWSRKK